MTRTLTYAAITPTRNEAENLRRLAPCMAAQSLCATRWIIVDNGSTDETPEIAHELADTYPWVSVLEIPGDRVATRGAPVVRAFHAGIAALTDEVDVVVKLDADISFEDHYFAEQTAAFQADPTLGIAGGVCMEPRAGRDLGGSARDARPRPRSGAGLPAGVPAPSHAAGRAHGLGRRR